MEENTENLPILEIPSDTTIEYEVIIGKHIVLGIRSKLRYCTLGGCTFEGVYAFSSIPREDQAVIEHCLINFHETDIAKLWTWAHQHDIQGHLV